MEIANVTYGNPSIENKRIITEPSYLDDLFLKLKQNHFPDNDSELAKDELNELVDYLSSMNNIENDAFLKRYKAYDRSLSQIIISTFKQRNIDVDELVKEIFLDIRSLIFKLKYFYQRPRPYQLAQYYKLNLFPFNSFSSSTPSYPSGHFVQAYVALNVIGSKYPSEYIFCKDMIADVGDSRMYLGLHFATDNDFGKEVGKEILKHKIFTQKYKI